MSDHDQVLDLVADAHALLAKIDRAPLSPTIMLAGALVSQALDRLNAAAGIPTAPFVEPEPVGAASFEAPAYASGSWAERAHCISGLPA